MSATNDDTVTATPKRSRGRPRLSPEQWEEMRRQIHSDLKPHGPLTIKEAVAKYGFSEATIAKYKAEGDKGIFVGKFDRYGTGGANYHDSRNKNQRRARLTRMTRTQPKVPKAMRGMCEAFLASRRGASPTSR